MSYALLSLQLFYYEMLLLQYAGQTGTVHHLTTKHDNIFMIAQLHNTCPAPDGAHNPKRLM